MMKQAGRMGLQAWEAFLDGLQSRSLLACLGMLLLVTMQMAALSFFVTEEAVSGIEAGVLMSAPDDYDAHVTVEALRLKHGQSRNLTVVCTGDSMISEALDDPDRIASQLSELVGPVDFSFLATDLQTLWETVILLDQLPETFRGVVIIPLSPLQVMHGQQRLKKVLASPRMALYSETFDLEVRKAGLSPPPQCGVYFIDHNRFFVARTSVMGKWSIEPVALDRHMLTRTDPPWTEATWKRNEAKLRDLVHLENMPEMFELLERMLLRLRKREGVQVVLLDLPRHPRTMAIFGDAEQEYETRLSQLANRLDVPCWSLTQDACIEPEDFHDPAHLGSTDARRRFQAVVCQRISQLLIASEDPR